MNTLKNIALVVFAALLFIASPVFAADDYLRCGEDGCRGNSRDYRYDDYHYDRYSDRNYDRYYDGYDYAYDNYRYQNTYQSDVVYIPNTPQTERVVEYVNYKYVERPETSVASDYTTVTTQSVVDNSLSASAEKSGRSFFGTFISWLILGVLILGIVLILRKLSGGGGGHH